MARGRGVGRRGALAWLGAGVSLLAGCQGRRETDDTTTETTRTTGTTRTTETERTTRATETAESTTKERFDGPPGSAVATDQVGYHAVEPVVAIVPESMTEAAVEGEGETTAAALSAPVTAPAAGESVRRASARVDPGEYEVTDGASARSLPFRVGTDPHRATLHAVVRAYSLKRSNTATEDPVTGLDIDAGHEQDARAQLYFDGEFRDEGDRLDVSGGWYDAGDYGKYVPTAAVTAGQLLLAHELFAGAFEGLSIPHAAGGLPPLLAEVRFELEWLARMQRPDGALYHKVAGREWPAMDTRPAADDQPRHVFGLSTFGTAMFAGAAAMAARVYRPLDGPFADRMLDAAESAHGYLEDTPDPRFRFDEGQDAGSGSYRKDGDATERLWAAAELFRTTGEAAYGAAAERHADRLESPPTAVSWADASALGQWAYLRADAADPERRAAVRESFLGRADDLAAAIAADGYRVALGPDEYRWGSAKAAVARGTLLLLANEARDAPDPEHLARARDQVHYVLGRSPTGRSYVTGAGERPPQNPHDRLVESTGTYVPGLLVGGPNSRGGDPLIDEYIAATAPPPAKAYLDRTGSYATNEWAIDYSAPLVLALAGLDAQSR